MTKDQQVENRIMKATIKALLAAEFLVSVQDGSEITLKRSASAKAIYAAMKTTDEDFLIASQDCASRGWVQFVYGNGGAYVISDYSTRLEAVLKPVNDLAASLEV